MSDSAIGKALREKEVLLVVGAGGVGKTTVAATLALHASLQGTRSIVCTIDPAKRLANSLGLSELGNDEARISDEQFAKAGLTPKAPLFAMMLDMKKSWDELVEQHTAAEMRERILSNKFYQALSTQLAGSQEYIAMDKLWQLKDRGAYPLIVLDTPPTAHALDFLNAPNRLLDFLDNEAAKWLLQPALKVGRVGLKLFSLGGGYITKTISRFTGSEVLEELARLLTVMAPLNDNFRHRAKGMSELIRSPKTGFILVTAPMAERLDEAIQFRELLKQNGMDLVAIVVNRVHGATNEETRAAAEAQPAALKVKLTRTLDEQNALAAQDAAGIAQLRAACPGVSIVVVPRFDLDVHDLAGLHATSAHLLK